MDGPYFLVPDELVEFTNYFGYIINEKGIGV